MKKLNILLTFTLFCVSFIANAQKGQFIIRGKVGHYSAPAKAYLLYQLDLGGTLKRDSALINNGFFTLKGSIPYPVETFLIIDTKGSYHSNSKSSQYNSIYLEPGVISVTSPDSLANAKVTGGPVNTDNEKIKILLKPIEEKQIAELYKGSCHPECRGCHDESAQLNDSVDRRHGSTRRAAHDNRPFCVFAWKTPTFEVHLVRQSIRKTLLQH